MRALLSWFLSLLLALGPTGARAQSKDDYMVPEDLGVGAKGSEYISGSTPDAVLMRVNIWGGVQKPGIHYVPLTTDLVTLLSYAGGPTKDADIDEITIRRRSKKVGAETTVDVDVKKLLRDAQAVSPPLQPNDIIVVPESKPIVSSNTLSALTVTATLLGIVLSYLAIKNAPK